MSPKKAAELLEIDLEAYQRIEAGEIDDLPLEQFMTIVYIFHFSVDALSVGVYEGSESLTNFE